jgi:hypothetical protein
VQNDNQVISVIFALLGSLHVKAACETLMKLTPVECVQIFCAIVSSDKHDPAFGVLDHDGVNDSEWKTGSGSPFV